MRSVTQRLVQASILCFELLLFAAQLRRLEIDKNRIAFSDKKIVLVDVTMLDS